MTACSRRISDGAVKVYNHTTTSEYQYFYLEALRQQALGNGDATFDLITHCIELDSLEPSAYYLAALYYLDLGKDSIVQDYLQKAVSLNPQNDAYHERLGQWYIQSRNYDKAIDAYEYLFQENAGRTDVLDILLQLYQQQKNYDMMLTTIDRIEQAEGLSEQITLSKMQVYQLKGDKNSAFKSLQSLADEHPNDINYKLMMGNWLLRNDRADEAREIFLKAESDEPNNEYVAASLYDFYRQQNEDSLTQIYRDRILLNKYTEPRTRMTMMQQVIGDSEEKDGDSIKVLQLFDEVMKAAPDDADIAQLKAIYMGLKHMPDDEIEDAWGHVLDIAPDNASSRLNLVRSRWDKEDWDGIISLCEPALEYNPDEMAFCYFLGLAHYQKDETEKALEAFRHGVSRINKDSEPSIVSDFYALMGDILHQLGRNNEAYAAYDSCLQWKSDNISCLNNYAYYMCESEGDLKKAEAMSLKTVNEEPNNSTYLDTYAWILYREERFMEALSFIDRAVENADSLHNNSTIYEHAGDIRLSCDDREGAVLMWKRALDEGSEYADRLKKKIKDNEK